MYHLTLKVVTATQHALAALCLEAQCARVRAGVRLRCDRRTGQQHLLACDVSQAALAMLDRCSHTVMPCVRPFVPSLVHDADPSVRSQAIQLLNL